MKIPVTFLLAWDRRHLAGISLSTVEKAILAVL